MIIRIIGSDVYKITTNIDEATFIQCNHANGFFIVDSLPHSVSEKYKFIDGEIVVDEEAELKALVPRTITKLQAMKQLKAIDKWNTLKAILASDEDVNDEWQLSDNLNRTYPLVLGMAQALDISDEELDTLFIEASKL